MEAYGNWDFETMKTFYHEAVVFEDPTASVAFETTFKAEGKENVYGFFRNIFKDQFKDDKPPYVNFKVAKRFQSDHFVIFNTVFESLLPLAWFRESGEEKILVVMPFVTILEFEGDKIIGHTDYGDYKTYNEQIQAQLRE